jgi:hypothetical protein
MQSNQPVGFGSTYVSTEVPWATGPHPERGPVRRSGPPASLTPTRVSPTTTTEYEQHYEHDQYSLHGHGPSPPASAVQRVTTAPNLVAVIPPANWTFVHATCTCALIRHHHVDEQEVTGLPLGGPNRLLRITRLQRHVAKSGQRHPPHPSGRWHSRRSRESLGAKRPLPVVTALQALQVHDKPGGQQARLALRGSQ